MTSKLLEWREDFSLGVPAVDHEHRELIGLINELYEDLQRPQSESDVGDFLGELFARISAHFALEEKIMRDSRYDEYRDHKGDHERLLDEIRDLMDDFDDDEVVDVEAFGRTLEHWFSEHFRTRDARMHRKLG